MKKYMKVLVAAAIMSVAASQSYAQLVVRVRPHHARVVVHTRPVRPSANHVWVEEEWVPQGRTYVWHGGYWAAPPRPGAVYVPGHWRHTWRGDTWVPGHWR